MTGFPKPRPRLLEIRAKRAQIDTRDANTRKRVKQRSGGRCEVIVLTPRNAIIGGIRCVRSACHVHHLLGGNGQRGVGLSANWRTQLHTCLRCHQEITHKVLRPQGTRHQRTFAALIRYERVS